MKKQTIQYTFIRFPRAFYTNPVFKEISLEGRNLLILLYDRLELSKLNSERFTDENGEVFVIYTVEEICDKFGCGNKKVTKLFRELEASGMIYRRRKNGSRPARIYLTNKFLNELETEFAKCQNDVLQSVGTTSCKVSETPPINNEYSNNNINNNESATFVTDDEIREQIEYDCLFCEETAGMLNQIIMVISDVLNGKTPTVKIGREELPRELVIQRFRMIDGDHVTSVMWQLGRNKTQIRNMKDYLIMKLYDEVQSGECEAVAALAMSGWSSGWATGGR